MNTWVICSMCHKKVHHLTYKGYTLKKNKTNEQRVVKNTKNASSDMIRKTMKSELKSPFTKGIEF